MSIIRKGTRAPQGPCVTSGWNTATPWLIEITDNDMAPDLFRGDVVAVDAAHRRPAPAGLYAIFDGKEILIRRLDLLVGSDPRRVRVGHNLSNRVITVDGWTLQPDWREVYLTDLDIRGRVMGAFKRMPEYRPDALPALEAPKAGEVRS